MTVSDLVRTSRGAALLALSVSIVGAAGRGIEAAPQAGAQVPVVSKDPRAQQQIEMQLTGAMSARLDPNARVAGLSLTNRPLNEILDAVAKSGGITFRYAQGMTGRLSMPSTVALSDRTVEDALRTVLSDHAMTFLAMGSKTAFIYPDTPAAREKYTASIRVFPIAKANVGRLSQELNQALKPTADGFRPMVLTTSDSPVMVVWAIPELMAWIEKWIADHDKEVPGGAAAAQAPSAEVALSEAEVRWQARKPKSYEFAIEVVCFCFGIKTPAPRFAVTDGKPSSLEELEGMSLKAYDHYNTIEKLFAAIRRSFSFGTYRSSVTYDPELGYPVIADLDPRREVADDELILRVKDFKSATR